MMRNVSAAIGTQVAPTSGVDEPTEEAIEKKGLEYGGGDIGEGKFTPFNLDEVRQLGNIGKDGELRGRVERLVERAQRVKRMLG